MKNDPMYDMVCGFIEHFQYMYATGCQVSQSPYSGVHTMKYWVSKGYDVNPGDKIDYKLYVDVDQTTYEEYKEYLDSLCDAGAAGGGYVGGMPSAPYCNELNYLNAMKWDWERYRGYFISQLNNKIINIKSKTGFGTSESVSQCTFNAAGECSGTVEIPNYWKYEDVKEWRGEKCFHVRYDYVSLQEPGHGRWGNDMQIKFVLAEKKRMKIDVNIQTSAGECQYHDVWYGEKNLDCGIV